MLDFMTVEAVEKPGKKRAFYVRPKFKVGRSKDLMIRGSDFYAIWDEERGFWSTDENDAIRLIDEETRKAYEMLMAEDQSAQYIPQYIWDADTRLIKIWHQYCKFDLRDNSVQLDSSLTFGGPTKRTDYASKCLPYTLADIPTPGWDGLVSVLYSPENREKIEWAIGSIVAGDSKTIQKFLVFYGSHGTGKSTVLHIIEMLFDGYTANIDAKALGNSSASFALEQFRDNPLVAIQHDGDLSHIDDNTRLNSLVSHEKMTVNEKFKSTYVASFGAMVFMGTNRPVKITDIKSGLIRRLIDVVPTGETIPRSEYNRLFGMVKFELGGIAQHCLDFYRSDPHRYDDYEPVSMMQITNIFYDFVEKHYYEWRKNDCVALNEAWELYKVYMEEAKLQRMLKGSFREELKGYFTEVLDTGIDASGNEVRWLYKGFRSEIFDHTEKKSKPVKTEPKKSWLDMTSTEKSPLDIELQDSPAQLTNDKGNPKVKWERCTTRLKDLDTSELHYVKCPENLITVDFDIPDESGNKCFALNKEAAEKFAPTYAELSKSGEGIHLTYWYTGDVSELASTAGPHVEIKVFSGNSSLRRKLTKHNGLPISKISSGLPVKEKGDKQMTDSKTIETEQKLRALINKALAKKLANGTNSTRCNIDFIYNMLEKANSAGLSYDVSDLKAVVYLFALNSTHQKNECVAVVNKMKFISDLELDSRESESKKLAFFDFEVFPNVIFLNWKVQWEDEIHRIINPTSHDVAEMLKYRCVGYNNLRYDNALMWCILNGGKAEDLYKLSQRIIVQKDRSAVTREAQKLSYTDVYDFLDTKQSLKKWEVEIASRTVQWLKKRKYTDEEIRIIQKGGTHKECPYDWNKPLPEECWDEVSKYCDNDVINTEAVFVYSKAAWTARQILADLAHGTVNNTTNELTAKMIFGTNRNPQDEFNWRDMGDMNAPLGNYVPTHPDLSFAAMCDPEWTKFDQYGRAVFPGYRYENGVSYYRGETIGEGGYVDSIPGLHGNVALLDIMSMHPHSGIAEQIFGPRYTARYAELVQTRVMVKHQDWDRARLALDGALTTYIQKVIDGLITHKDLAQALKIAINAVYGMTSAKFSNIFKDPRNVDNMVAKRGELFMINLKHEVQNRGFKVAHIKTDSIKIADATDEIIEFCMNYARLYGYTFEHEATYERFCLKNKSTYIASEVEGGYSNKEPHDHRLGEWVPKGNDWAYPYVWKTMFSHEDIVFDDLCKIFESKAGPMVLLDDEGNEQFIGKVGRFVPIKAEFGGKRLVCRKEKPDGTIGYNAMAGTSGYLFREAEEFLESGGSPLEIDMSYWNALLEDAKATIQEMTGDYDWFMSDRPYEGPSFVGGVPVYTDEITY